MAELRNLANDLAIVTCEPDAEGQRFRARLMPSRYPRERGKVHLSTIGTALEGGQRAEVFGYITPDDAVMLAEQLLRVAGKARTRGRKLKGSE